MVVVAVTGSASGCGYEAVRQLSSCREISQIVITTRSLQKAEEARSRLASETGKPQAFYVPVVLDLGSLTSIDKAVDAFPVVDRICLNAGGAGTGQMHASGNGMTDSMVINTVGHAALVDKLIAAAKIRHGGRIVYVGSEASRNMWSSVPLVPQYCGVFGEKDLDWAITTNYDGMGSWLPARRQLADYKNAKIVGQMHFSHLAKELPGIHVMSVSPGSIGGTFGEAAHFPIKQSMENPAALRCMLVSPSCSGRKSVELGARRYVEVLMGDAGEWTPGAVALSGYPFPCCCCLWAGYGPLLDNRPIVPYLRDEALCANAAFKVRERVATWASSAPVQETMSLIKAAGSGV